MLGEGGWSQDPDRLAPKLVEWRDRWSGSTPLLVLPRSTAEVAAIVGVFLAGFQALDEISNFSFQAGNAVFGGIGLEHDFGAFGAFPSDRLIFHNERRV